MTTQIARKFLVKKMPDLTGIEKVVYHRFYLYSENGIDLRIQQVDEKFELERKVKVTDLTRNGEKMGISEEEFNLLKKQAIGEIVRDSYLLQVNPRIVLRIYHKKFEGLVRAEVDFENESEAKTFQPPDWFGQEITTSPLGRDSQLLKLTDDNFQKLLG